MAIALIEPILKQAGTLHLGVHIATTAHIRIEIALVLTRAQASRVESVAIGIDRTLISHLWPSKGKVNLTRFPSVANKS